MRTAIGVRVYGRTMLLSGVEPEAKARAKAKALVYTLRKDGMASRGTSPWPRYILVYQEWRILL